METHFFERSLELHLRFAPMAPAICYLLQFAGALLCAMGKWVWFQGWMHLPRDFPAVAAAPFPEPAPEPIPEPVPEPVLEAKANKTKKTTKKKKKNVRKQ